jgi:hypothetical protein
MILQFIRFLMLAVSTFIISCENNSVDTDQTDNVETDKMDAGGYNDEQQNKLLEKEAEPAGSAAD